MEGYSWDGARLLLEVYRGRTRGKCAQDEDGKIHLDVRKSAFTTRVVKHWSEMCREVVGPLFLDTLKQQRNMALSNLIQLDLCWAGVGVGTCRDSCQPLLSCHSLVNPKGHFWTRYLSLFLFLHASCISISTSTGCGRYQIHCTGWPSFQPSDT